VLWSCKPHIPSGQFVTWPWLVFVCIGCLCDMHSIRQLAKGQSRVSTQFPQIAGESSHHGVAVMAEVTFSLHHQDAV